MLVSLTPKFLCIFLPNSIVFDIVGKPIFQKIKVWVFNEVTVETWSYLCGNMIPWKNSF